jgi:hypothetical protein
LAGAFSADRGASRTVGFEVSGMDCRGGRRHAGEFCAPLLLICTFLVGSNIFQQLPIFYRLACCKFQSIPGPFNRFQQIPTGCVGRCSTAATQAVVEHKGTSGMLPRFLSLSFFIASTCESGRNWHLSGNYPANAGY